MPAGFEIVDLHPDDHLWIFLADALLSAIPPEGVLPDTQKAHWILENGLGHGAIRHPLNKEYALRHLRDFFQGRQEGLNDSLETEKKARRSKEKTNRKRGRSPSVSKPRRRRR